MTSQEIKENLNRLALNQNWGTVEFQMVDEHGGIPENIAIIQDALTYINLLEQERDMKARDVFAIIEEIRRDMAKEIGDCCKQAIRFVMRDKGATSIPYRQKEAIIFEKIDKEIARFIKQRYGVEVK